MMHANTWPLPDDRWQDRAGCRDTDPAIWFPTREDGPAAIERLRTICRACPVQAECLDDQLWERDGFRAGLTALERREIRARRRKAGNPVPVKVPSVGRMLDVAPHDTEAAYRRHLRNGEPACQVCLDGCAAAKAMRREVAS